MPETVEKICWMLLLACRIAPDSRYHRSDAVRARDRPPDHEHVGRVVAREGDHGKERSGNQLPPRQGDVLFVNSVGEFGEALREKLAESE